MLNGFECWIVKVGSGKFCFLLDSKIIWPPLTQSCVFCLVANRCIKRFCICGIFHHGWSKAVDWSSAGRNGVWRVTIHKTKRSKANIERLSRSFWSLRQIVAEKDCKARVLVFSLFVLPLEGPEVLGTEINNDVCRAGWTLMEAEYPCSTVSQEIRRRMNNPSYWLTGFVQMWLFHFHWENLINILILVWSSKFSSQRSMFQMQWTQDWVWPGQHWSIRWSQLPPHQQ